MAGARQRAEWDRTANVLALLANVHRDPKRTRAYRPSDFHPFAPARSALRKVKGAELRDALKEAFLPSGERQVTLRPKP